jgi:hypothetical protein
VEVKDMDMLEVEGMNVLEARERTLNYRPEGECMNMVGIHMVEVEHMNKVEEHPSKERQEVEEHLSKERQEVEGMNMERMDMVEDTMTEVNVEDVIVKNM